MLLRLERLLLAVVLAISWSGSYSHAIESPNGPLTPSLAAAASDETAGTAIDQGLRCREAVVYIEWGTGVTAGAIRFETARTTGYSGTWSVQGSVATFAGTAPKAQTMHISGTYAAVRSTIDATVANGTVSTWIGCN